MCTARTDLGQLVNILVGADWYWLMACIPLYNSNSALREHVMLWKGV